MRLPNDLRGLLAITVVAVLLLALPDRVHAADEPELVIILKMKFQPQEITIKKGRTVRWENREKRQYHSVWFEQQGDPEPDYFFPEEFYERGFDKVGDFPYRCGPHPEMTGVVHVVE
jgi:plastocyanin